MDKAWIRVADYCKITRIFLCSMELEEFGELASSNDGANFTIVALCYQSKFCLPIELRCDDSVTDPVPRSIMGG